MSKPFFFVLGAPKSGTTWMQKALNHHPELLCRGEGKFTVFRKELGKAAAKYSNHIEGYQRRVFGEEYFPPFSRTEFDQVYRCFMETRLIGDGVPPGVKRVGNKDPEHGMVLRDLAGHFPDADFIHVIRDPRDVAVSTWHHMRRVEPGFVEKVGGFEQASRQVVLEWLAYVGSVRRVSKEMELSYLEVRYEDLHAQPTEHFRRVLDRLKVSVAADVIEQCLDFADFERATGGRPRGVADTHSFYRKGEVGDWGNHMNPELAALLLESTKGLAADLGYR